MPLERTDVDYPLWRKKVDSTLFNHNSTPIPNWACTMWKVKDQFSGSRRKNSEDAKVAIIFESHVYQGWVTISGGESRKNPLFRLWFSDDLMQRLKDVFLMSYMRDIEARLRNVKSSTIENEISFWEFLDIEYDNMNRKFIFTAHFTQKPTFPELFKRLVGSPVISRIDDELQNKSDVRIHKQSWKPRYEFKTELGAKNVIYTLVDTEGKLLYVGEAKDLIARFKQGHSRIPNWNYYRYNTLPKELVNYRVVIERMLIRDYASVFLNMKGLNTRGLSDYMLVNEKIDK